jgi:hypothetical protein
VDKKMSLSNGYHDDLKESIANIDGKLDQALNSLGTKVEILSTSINHLTVGLTEFKELFRSAVPIKLVIILLAIVAGIFGVAEGLKTALGGLH